MKADRLHALAEAYGADLRRWPASERVFAESLIAADPSLKTALAQAAALDALLDASPCSWARAGRRPPAPAWSRAWV